MSKKIFAFLLAAMLVFAAVPAFAEGFDTQKLIEGGKSFTEALEKFMKDSFEPKCETCGKPESECKCVELPNILTGKTEKVDLEGFFSKLTEGCKDCGDYEELLKKLQAGAIDLPTGADFSMGDIIAKVQAMIESFNGEGAEKAGEELEKAAKDTGKKIIKGIEDTAEGMIPEEAKGLFGDLDLDLEKYLDFDLDNLKVDPEDLDPFDFPDTVTLSYDANGDNVKGLPSAQTHKMISKVTMFIVGKAPTREGYKFKGYNTSADGTGFWSSPFLQLYTSKDMTLYAIWELDGEPAPTSSSSPSPKTGDTSSTALYIALMASSILALALVAGKRRSSAK